MELRDQLLWKWLATGHLRVEKKLTSFFRKCDCDAFIMTPSHCYHYCDHTQVLLLSPLLHSQVDRFPGHAMDICHTYMTCGQANLSHMIATMRHDVRICGKQSDSMLTDCWIAFRYMLIHVYRMRTRASRLLRHPVCAVHQRIEKSWRCPNCWWVKTHWIYKNSIDAVFDVIPSWCDLVSRIGCQGCIHIDDMFDE